MLKIIPCFPQNTAVNSATTQWAINGLRNGKKKLEKGFCFLQRWYWYSGFKKKNPTAHKQKPTQVFKIAAKRMIYSP